MTRRSTTVLAVIRDGQVAVGADGQITFDDTVVKHTARKVRRLAGGQVLAGFAGAVADALTLLEQLERIHERHRGNLERSVVEFARQWRQDRMLRRLEAFLIVVDTSRMFLLSGAGDVIEPEEPILAVGSGGAYALAAARALYRHTDLSAEAIVRESIQIASEICIYTNDQIQVLTLGASSHDA